MGLMRSTTLDLKLKTQTGFHEIYLLLHVYNAHVLEKWEWVSFQSMPTPCCSHTAEIICQRHPKICMFGGWNGTNLIFDNLFFFDLDTMTWVESSWGNNSRPARRFAHAGCVLKESDALVIFAGVNEKVDLNDIFTIGI